MLLGRVDFPVRHLNCKSKQNSIQELRLLGDVSRYIEASNRCVIHTYRHSAHCLLRTSDEDRGLLTSRR